MSCKFYIGKVQFQEDSKKQAKYFLSNYLSENYLLEINNIIFKQTFVFSNLERGNHSINAIFISKDNLLKVSMFPSNLEEMLLNPEIRFPEITGYWTFVKKGTSIGIKFWGFKEPMNRNRLCSIEELLLK